eukprot:214824_1
MGGIGGNNDLIGGLISNAMAGIGGNIALTIPETAVEMKDENKNENEDNSVLSPDAKNVTSSHLIKIIQTYPETTDINTLKGIYSQGMNTIGQTSHRYWSNERVNKGSNEDIWLIFDVSEIKIDSFNIVFLNPYNDKQNTLKAVKVFTSKTVTNINDKHEWQLIKIKQNVSENEKQTFYLKSKHERYIKICIDADTVHINCMKWNGFEPMIHDEITNKIKVYQTCGQFESIDSHFISKIPSKSWLIFDCKRYEIDRISIQFAAKCKCKMVNVKLNDVAPRYSFDNIKPVMQWILNTSESWDDKSWSDIELFEELSFLGNEYNNGFKRYLYLECNQYITTELKIENIKFYGKLSQQISDNDEQFDSILDIEQEEKKEDCNDLEPYQFKIIDHSATMSGKIENIWSNVSHEFWMSSVGLPPYIILDLGNNPVEEIWIKQFNVSAMHSWVPSYKQCKISTNHKISKEWELIIEDNEFEKTTTDPDGAKYNISGKIKKYLKLEFFIGDSNGMINGVNAMMMAMFSLSSLRLFGNSPFLESLNKQITMDDIKNMKHVDQDLIHLYKKTEREKYEAAALTYALAANNPCLEKLSNEWMDAKIKEYNNQALIYYMSTELDAYQKTTEYEKKETLKIAKMQEQLAEQYVKEKLLQNDIDHFKKYIKMEQEHETAKELLDNTKDFEQKALFKKDVDNKFEILRNQNIYYYNKQSEFRIELNDKINALYTDNRHENIYKLWKDAIENHPKEISNEYNVYEYTQCLKKYAKTQHKDEYKKLLGKLADLFDESMEKKKELLHKFFVFQLSGNYWEARTQSFGRPPVTVLFDCGHEYRRKVNRLEFKISKPCNINKIVVSSAGELREEKMDSKDTDDDETHYDWNNFNFINELILDDKLKSEKKKKKK